MGRSGLLPSDPRLDRRTEVASTETAFQPWLSMHSRATLGAPALRWRGLGPRTTPGGDNQFVLLKQSLSRFICPRKSLAKLFRLCTDHHRRGTVVSIVSGFPAAALNSLPLGSNAMIRMAFRPHNVFANLFSTACALCRWKRCLSLLTQQFSEYNSASRCPFANPESGCFLLWLSSSPCSLPQAYC